MHVNAQGLNSHLATLTAHLRLLPNRPALVCVTETHLNRSTEVLELEGYEEVARRDRAERGGGGVLVYALKSFAKSVVHLESSTAHERVWLTVHTDLGPYLLGVWYRPPSATETLSVTTLPEELEKWRGDALGVLLLGDLNVHHVGWLRHSTSTTLAGRTLKEVAGELGLQPKVRGPTHNKGNLLDLVLTDLEEARVTVHPRVADHNLVEVELPLPLPKVKTLQRQVWRWDLADWAGLKNALQQLSWETLREGSVTDAAQHFHQTVLNTARDWVPQRTVKEPKGTHPWLNEKVLSLVASKRAAEGTEGERLAAEECSRGVLEEYRKYVDTTKQELQELRAGSKLWWKRSRELLQRRVGTKGVAALKTADGAWLHGGKAKADLFGSTFTGKYALPPQAENAYSALGLVPSPAELTLPTEDLVLEELLALRVDSATGPDLLATRLLKECAFELAGAVAVLTCRVLQEQEWPDCWREHWIVPLHKKKAVWQASNYRGVHLTPQVSKVVERVLKRLLQPFLEKPLAQGPFQFAYTKDRGARDALLYLVLSLLQALNSGLKVALYCSDVAGAFDRVDAERLQAKLQRLGLPRELLGVLASWLGPRRAQVVVDGEHSEVLLLANMVFQGTVLGPSLWNVYYADAKAAVNAKGFQELVYADDLNCWKAFDRVTPNKEVLAAAGECQRELHKWGASNRVVFDPGKESVHVVSTTSPEGGNFTILGVEFDPKLVMRDAVTDLVTHCRWKLQQLLRGRRYFSVKATVQLYKAHLLSFLEYRTPALYHASPSVLAPLDQLQRHLLHELGLTEEDALVHFALAPLQVRRDVAMLGVVHRAALRKGPPQLWPFFALAQAQTAGPAT